MIQGVFGLPGMGKTTFLTKCAQMCLQGKVFMGVKPKPIVFTNFECEGCYRLDFEKLGLYNFADCLILIDEIMLFADTRNFKTFPEHLKRFFAKHRHSNIDIIWCSQFWDDCDKKIRVLTQKFYLLERGKILKDFSFIKPIERHMGASNKKMNDEYVLAAPIEWRFVYRPKYYSKFDSFDREPLPPLELVSWSDPDPVSIDLSKEKAPQ